MARFHPLPRRTAHIDPASSDACDEPHSQPLQNPSGDGSVTEDVLQKVRATLADTRQFLRNEEHLHDVYAEMQTAWQDMCQEAVEVEEGSSDKLSFAAAQCMAQYHL